MRTCAECGGSGAQKGSGPTTCQTCNGYGQVRFQQGFFSITRTCSHCHGTGQIIKNRCTLAMARAGRSAKRSLELKIPAGVDSGSKLRVSGEGDAGGKGARGRSLTFSLNVQEHEFFERREHDLHCHIPITFPQAALGTQIGAIPPSKAMKRSSSIPAGTQTGRDLPHQKPRHFQAWRFGSRRPFVTVNVSVPAKLSREQKELLTKLASTIETENKPIQKKILERVKEIFSLGSMPLPCPGTNSPSMFQTISLT